MQRLAKSTCIILIGMSGATAAADIVTYRLEGIAVDYGFWDFEPTTDIQIAPGDVVTVDLAINYIPVAADAAPGVSVDLEFFDPRLIDRFTVTVEGREYELGGDIATDTERVYFDVSGERAQAHFSVTRAPEDRLFAFSMSGVFRDGAYHPSEPIFPSAPIDVTTYDGYSFGIGMTGSFSGLVGLGVLDADGVLEIIPAPGSASLLMPAAMLVLRRRRYGASS